MTEPSRRSFLGAPAAAAAAVYAEPLIAGADSVARETSPADITALIARERKTIQDAMARAGVEGVAVGLIVEGVPVWIEGFGVTDRNNGRPVDRDTIFSIQSTSKNVTASAILIAVQRGLLDLDAPITKYLPDFTVNSRFEADPQERITLRLLLAHRAGFTHEAPIGNNYDPASPSFSEHVRSISDTWLRYPVGERYRYSNLGYDLAGYILQLQSGMPFADYMRIALFEPIGMRDSTVSTEVYVAQANRAIGHLDGYDLVPLRIPMIPSGGVYTSASDFAAYAQFHLSEGRAGGRAVLTEARWQEMHGFALGGDYSLGVIREERRYGDTQVRMLSHKGGGFGFGSVFYYCPEAKLAWFAFFNRPADDCYRFGEALIDGALARRFGPRKPRLPVDDLAPVILPPTWLDRYSGNYIARDFSADIAVHDHSFGMIAEGKFTPLQFLAPDTLYAADGGSAVTYRFYAATASEPAHLECFVGENSLDRNEGPREVPGPDLQTWSRFEGRYRVYQWGKAADGVTVSRKNGYLYLNNIRLVTEFEPGLFFTSDGEAVDFRQAVPTWKNIRLVRI